MVTAAIIAVPALGMTLALAMGALDLSIGSLQALAACTVAILLGTVGIPLSIGATLLLGAGVGLANGLIVTRLGVPAFVATLGAMSVLRGAALLITDGQSILLMDQPGFAQLNSGQLLGVPIPVLIALGAFAVLWLVMRSHAVRAARLRHRRQRACRRGDRPAGRPHQGGRLHDRGRHGGAVGRDADLTADDRRRHAGARPGAAGHRGRRPRRHEPDGRQRQPAGHAPGGCAAGRHQQRPRTSSKVESFYQYLALGLLLIFALSLDTLRRAIIARAVTEGRL